MILPARLLYGVLIKLLEKILKHATSILMKFGIKNDCVNVELMMLLLRACYDGTRKFRK